MRNLFSRHPVSFMAFYLLFYLSAFHWLEVHIAVPDVLVHCHLDDLIPFCKYAIVPYFAWFLWIPFTLFYLLWTACAHGPTPKKTSFSSTVSPGTSPGKSIPPGWLATPKTCAAISPGWSSFPSSVRRTRIGVITSGPSSA